GERDGARPACVPRWTRSGILVLRGSKLFVPPLCGKNSARFGESCREVFVYFFARDIPGRSVGGDAHFGGRASYCGSMTISTADLFDVRGEELDSLALQLQDLGARANFDGPIRTVRCHR